MIFQSQKLSGAKMNRYGVVYVGMRQATPDQAAVVLREARDAGAKQVKDPDPDVGQVWNFPEEKRS